MTPVTLAALRTGGKAPVARALSAIETEWRSAPLIELLDAAWTEPRAGVIGVTGAPGVGKSSLIRALVREIRAQGETVAVLAIDPSSQRTGGAFLGDRTRIAADPGDPAVFVRSMAARDRLGGLAEHAFAATILLQAVYDRVIIESVGVGQSEGEARLAADTLLLCLQPGAGDALQFMKAGIMELPDAIAVTKADLGDSARRTCAEAHAALALSEGSEGRPPPFPVSVETRTGLDSLWGYLSCHRAPPEERTSRIEAWLKSQVMAEFGRQGLRIALSRGLIKATVRPFSSEAGIHSELLSAFGPAKA